MLRHRRNYEGAVLLISTRTGWTRTEIMDQPLPELLRTLRWLNPKKR